MEKKSYKLVQSWCLNPFEIVENNVLVLGHVARMVFFEGGKVILEYGLATETIPSRNLP